MISIPMNIRRAPLAVVSQRSLNIWKRDFFATTASWNGSPKNHGSRNEDAMIKERLSKIISDIPHGETVMDSRKETSGSDSAARNGPRSWAAIEQPSGVKAGPGSAPKSAPSPSGAAASDTPSPSATVMDIFNIKQIIETVKKSENVKALQQELVAFYENNKKTQKDLGDSLSKKMTHNVKELRSSIAIASTVVNEITGYNRVIKLKDVIVQNEEKLQELKVSIHKAKIEHEKFVEIRSSSQKEVNELLERKNSWTPVDLERFTKIYMTTHDLDKAVEKSSQDLKRLEDLQESTHDALIRSIMNRYHEEQVWSDKIRQFSTWGTILIMCINLLLVLLVQFVFEPFKRWRLVNSFEGKVKELFQNNEKLDSDIQALKNELQHLNLKEVAPIQEAVRAGDVTGSTEHGVKRQPETIVEDTTVPAAEGRPENIAQGANTEESTSISVYLVENIKRSLETFKLHCSKYYTVAYNWLDTLCQYMTPISWTNTTALNITVGEFQTYMIGSVTTSVLVGVILGRVT